MWWKKAFDKSFLNDMDVKGVGSFGEYYSNFTPEELEKIKRQMGQNSHNLGLKRFHRDCERKPCHLWAGGIELTIIIPYFEERQGKHIVAV